MKTSIKYTVSALILLLVVYHSIYFKPLDEAKAAAAESQFDAEAYARSFWNDQLIFGLDKAIDISQLLSLLHTAPDSAFQQYSHALGIGNIRFFLTKGQGNVIAVNENNVAVLVNTPAGQHEIKLATEYIFGNAVRDASGAININAFDNTMDFNNVSAEINKIIREEVLPPFRDNVQQGNLVQFIGALELNKEHLKLKGIEVIPVQLKILK